VILKVENCPKLSVHVVNGTLLFTVQLKKIIEEFFIEGLIIVSDGFLQKNIKGLKINSCIA
jgi:hypothetical protein